MIEPPAIAGVMSELSVWWAVAGGWAIDLWLDEQTREHHDVEVAVRRRDQGQIYSALCRDWELLCLDPPGQPWRPWRAGEVLSAPAFQVQARSAERDFDLFLETIDDGVWTFRRDDRIRLPLDEVWVATEAGVPVIRPHIQLLYMAKSDEPKNQHDFDVVRPRLSDVEVDWLRRSLTLVLPGHRWIDRL
jgi:PAS domain-containing protein